MVKLMFGLVLVISFGCSNGLAANRFKEGVCLGQFKDNPTFKIVETNENFVKITTKMMFVRLYETYPIEEFYRLVKERKMIEVVCEEE